MMERFTELLAEAGQEVRSFEVAVESLIEKLRGIPEEHRPDLSAELATIGAYHTAVKTAISETQSADGLNLSNIAEAKADDDDADAKATVEEAAAAGGHSVTQDDTAKKITVQSAGGQSHILDDNAKTITQTTGTVKHIVDGNNIDAAKAEAAVKAEDVGATDAKGDSESATDEETVKTEEPKAE